METIKELIVKIQENRPLYITIRIALIVLFAMIVRKILDTLFEKQINKRVNSLKHKTKAMTVLSVVKNVLNILIYFFMITSILNVFNINTSSILAVAGVGGFAIAFASQSIVQDIINGSFLLIEDQFNIGDLVTINGITGTVNFIGFRITKLHDIDGREIIFPNSQIKTVINNSINPMRAVAIVSVTSFKDLEFVKSAINEGLENTKKRFEYFTQDPEIKGVEDIGDFSYKFLIVGFTDNGMQWDAQRIMREEILRKLIENNISFSSIDDSEE